MRQPRLTILAALAILTVPGLTGALPVAQQAPWGAWWHETIAQDHLTDTNYRYVDQDPTLALGPNNTPNIAFSAFTPFGFPFAYAQLLYARQEGATWSLHQITNYPNNAAREPSIALDAAGWPHIAFAYGLTGLGYGFENKTGWHFSVVDSGDIDLPQLALDSAGYAHIVYPDYSAPGANPETLRYAYQDPTGWHIQTITNSGSLDFGFALDASGIPHIAFCQLAFNGYSGWLVYGERSPNGNWTLQVLDKNGGCDTSIAIAPNGQPGIAYASYDTSLGIEQLNYTHRTSTGWVFETPLTQTNNPIFANGFTNEAIGVNPFGQATNIRYDAHGTPHIFYNEDGINDPYSEHLVYLTPVTTPVSSKQWDTEIADIGDDLGTSFQIGTDGAPRVAYGFDDNQGQMAYGANLGQIRYAMPLAAAGPADLVMGAYNTTSEYTAETAVGWLPNLPGAAALVPNSPSALQLANEVTAQGNQLAVARVPLWMPP
ncbi:MAG: hypothetical protein ACYDDF_15365 [Thermoplasmatota archaeon]